ncbi:hypothetical protein A6V36_13970 [Paraburkholderia ginsengiterrae]|uniref:Uncharacterized protein n=1 Tax=Paraburkholderia ginsengiterrae TaxID=1462993 RepID=A0A1A9MZ13_9BURK|nr:hypothetical protein [Paraburkholderia ginsengiterrae]OAJ52509.1 hypothetical protein A6V36_13970 [Paraburkholderia ginsengiterrae]OAJ52615.1 hypothetical protein A6V37_09230 [Paraburkholderia ginsengiterrae]
MPGDVDTDSRLKTKVKGQTMPTQYLTELPLFAGLPEDLRELVCDIEHHAGLRVIAESTAKEKMACEFGKRKAVIQVPEAGPPRASLLAPM